MSRPAANEALTSLKATLRAGDVRGALIYLNSLTEHRFSALYRFDKATLHNLYFFDRENPDQQTVADIPVLASYCVFVRDSQETFAMNDSHSDDRVSDHPKRTEVRSYCGVPLRDIDGQVFGSLCHFDFRPIPTRVENIDLMEAVARFIKEAPPAAQHDAGTANSGG